MSEVKDDYYADILIYVTGCVLFILTVIIIILCRMRMTTQKTLPTPPIQKLSKFPLKRQVTESRYKISKKRTLFSLFLPIPLLVLIYYKVYSKYVYFIELLLSLHKFRLFRKKMEESYYCKFIIIKIIYYYY